MKKLILLLFVLSFWSCVEDNTDLELRINLTHEGEPFTFFQNYTYPNGNSYRVTNITTYISDITVKNKLGQSDLISEVEFLDIGKTHQSTEASEIGYSLLFGDIAISDISSLDFRLGLTPEQNATVPSDYNSSNPLSRSAEYWLGWSSYIFTKVEGFYNPGNGEAEIGFLLHLGSDAVARNLSINQIKNDNNINLTLDVADIFKTNSGFYDIEATPRTHTLELLDQAEIVANNLAGAIKLSE